MATNLLSAEVGTSWIMLPYTSNVVVIDACCAKCPAHRRPAEEARRLLEDIARTLDVSATLLARLIVVSEARDWR